MRYLLLIAALLASASKLVKAKVYVDDCAECHTNGECKTAQPTDPKPSYCQCKVGYKGNGTFCEAMTCDNANPCSSNAICTTLAPTSMSCACKTGYTGDGYYCGDVNECSSPSTNACNQNATCSNTAGSYTCTCNSMFQGNGTFCEAKTCANSKPCSSDSDCTLKDGSFHCTCKVGYTGGVTCSDIDECSSGVHVCHADATCSNTVGSYTCTCNSMYQGNGTFCEAKTCENSKPCSPNSDCSMLNGTFHCACKAGFTGGVTCTDIDECTTNICHSEASCTNTQGSYDCTCNSGYTGNGAVCTDVNECVSKTDNCHVNATCTNTVGSYTCACNPMFQGNGTYCEIKTCENSKPCSTNADCSIKNGAFHCQCKPGFTDGVSCSDIDECSLKTDTCHPNATCSNTEGSYKCTCNSMFQGNGTYCQAKTCENTKPCSKNSLCSMEDGKFHCQCKPGFTGVITCTDIDECGSSALNNCNENATCVNIMGSFSCTCNLGFQGNGTFCAACPKCPEHSSCVLGDNDEAKCVCDTGYKDDSGTCAGFCGFETVTIDGQTYTFEEGLVGEIMFSNEKCSSGRAKASITCEMVNEKLGFNQTSFHLVPCNETVASVSAQVDWKTAVGEELEESISKLNVLVSSGGNLSTEDRQQFLNAVKTSSTSLVNKTDAVTVQTLKEVVVAANSVTESFKESLSKTPDSNENTTLVREAQDLVNALHVFASKVSLANSTVVVKTENIRAEVTTNLPPESTEYVYSSDTVKVSVPKEAIDQAKKQTSGDRIVVLEFEGDTLFPTEEKVDRIITVELGLDVKVKDLKTPLEFSTTNTSSPTTTPIPGKTQSLKSFPKCTFYVPKNFSFSTKGCCLTGNLTHPTCRCDHMTSFAVLVEHEVVDDDIVLSVVTTIGCIISAIGLVVTIVLNLTDKNIGLRTSRQRTLAIFVHICVTLLAVYLVFLIGVPRTENPDVCTAMSALLHYLLLATWCWTTVYSYIMYRSLAVLSSEFDERFLTKASAFAYGLPLLAVIITLFSNVATDPTYPNESNYCEGEGPQELRNSNFGQYLQSYRARNMCWITGNSLKFGFLVPAGLMLLINYIFFFFVIYLLANRRQRMRSHTNRRSSARELTASASMATTLGLTWLFGYLMLASDDEIYRDVMAWLFTLTNVSQGFILFIFTVIRRAELRERIYESLKSHFTSISTDMTSKMKVIKQGKKYVVNSNSTSSKEDETPSTTESTANIYKWSRNSEATQETSVVESSASENVE